MNDKKLINVHWSFWVITAFTLIWNILGSINFFMQMDPEILAAYRESERLIIEARPLWATFSFALAVFGGVLGCLLLMIRKSISLYLFIVSLAGVVVTMIHTLGVGISFGAGEILGIIVMPLLVAVFLIWYAKQAENKGWIC